MSVNRRFALSVMLTASLGAGVAVTAAGCGGSSPAATGTPAVTASPTASASATATATASGSAVNAALLASVISCLRSHGLAVADSAPLKQVKAAFKALPVTGQQSDFTACGPLLPATIRQKVAERIADEQAARPTASP
jgi:hypothetical protein